MEQPGGAMEPESLPAGRERPIGRGPKVRAAVLSATLAELAETGYAGLTVDNVAQRAGVHKTTVYRRWKDREALVLDALTEQVAADIPIPDTHAVETDLRELARSLVRMLTSPADRAVTIAMFSDAARVPEIGDVKRRFFADRFLRAEPVVTRAVERGELPAGTDPAELLKTLIAPIYLRLLITAEPVDETTADHAAQVALAAARAGALHPAGRERPSPAAGRSR
ncbi:MULTISPECIES: TetR/AcrR family transcriptional regulator [Streptosporangium]|uniref:AcrR family transcriptional regulator n=1 Tax=Streptosporangium brasiliense TaxID=47480 RepID=A0ABT9REX2_9ACTN|nr:TetR/AcrR family transcriptional regulator [Streptosporangium brasiliense]MDP9867806.1 AcrR family transcriptional regulator [Streptosporangium brasiliense]